MTVNRIHKNPPPQSSSYQKLVQEHPWLEVAVSPKEYLTPSYYEKLLKPYTFDGSSDLEVFRRFLMGRKKGELKMLEIGVGTGRGTSVTLQVAESPVLHLLDQSKQMLQYCQDKFSHFRGLEFLESDAITYLGTTDETYDEVYSLWSFSHSIHQNLYRWGFERGVKIVKQSLVSFLRLNLKTNGRVFIIHFDSRSPEQTILLKQKTKLYPFFKVGEQSPSQSILEEVLRELENERVVSYTVVHYDGQEIEFADQEEALEVFMNFHLEGIFNHSEILGEVLEGLTRDLMKYRTTAGTIRIKPACFVYSCSKCT